MGPACCVGFQVHSSTMAFLLSAKWAWLALNFILKQREELKKVRTRGFVVVVVGCTTGLGMDIVRAVCNRLSKTPSHTPHAVIITEKDEEKGLVSTIEPEQKPCGARWAKVTIVPISSENCKSSLIAQDGLLRSFVSTHSFL